MPFGIAKALAVACRQSRILLDDTIRIMSMPVASMRKTQLLKVNMVTVCVQSFVWYYPFLVAALKPPQDSFRPRQNPIFPVI